MEVILPRWIIPPDPAPALLDKWSRYMSSLTTHEDGHVELARNHEAAVDRAILEVPGARDCAELQEKVNSAIVRTHEEFAERHREYDRITDHGVTQGAEFP
jgi:predicted secreted Zn-dependent protease